MYWGPARLGSFGSVRLVRGGRTNERTNGPYIPQTLLFEEDGEMGTRSYAVIVWLANHPESTAYQISRGISGADPLEVLDILFEAEREDIVRCQRESTGLAFFWWVKFDTIPVRPVSDKAPGSPAGRQSLGNDATERG
jgi:hypothetical protein